MSAWKKKPKKSPEERLAAAGGRTAAIFSVSKHILAQSYYPTPPAATAAGIGSDVRRSSRSPRVRSRYYSSSFFFFFFFFFTFLFLFVSVAAHGRPGIPRRRERVLARDLPWSADRETRAAAPSRRAGRTRTRKKNSTSKKTRSPLPPLPIRFILYERVNGSIRSQSGGNGRRRRRRRRQIVIISHDPSSSLLLLLFHYQRSLSLRFANRRPPYRFRGRRAG